MLDLLLVFLTVLYIIWYVNSCLHPKHFPPGPRAPLPVIGDVYRLGSDIAKGLELFTKKYGRITGFWMGPVRAVAISDFDVLQHILNKNETANRTKPEDGYLVRHGLSFGEVPGVIFSNGITWSEVRRSSLHIFRDFGFGKNALEEMVEEEVDNLIQYIDDNWIDTPLNVSQFFNISVLAALWRVISGESLKIGDPNLQQLVTTIKDILKENSNPLLLISFDNKHLYKLFNNIGLVTFQKNIDKILEYCKNYIELHKSRPIDGNNPLTFIEAFLYKIQMIEDPMSPLHGETGELNLMNAIFDFFIAGTDTSANTLEWAMLYMIQNSEVQSKVREELQIHIGSKKPKMSERHLTPYTEAVLHEISRKGNIAPIAIEHSTTKSIEVGSYKIPSETIIFPMIGEVMFDPEHFPDPFKFNPERYLTEEENGNLKFTPHPRVNPFGIGKRRCLGEILARTTLYKFLTGIIQKYEILSGQDDPILDKSKGGFLNAPQDFKLIFNKL